MKKKTLTLLLALALSLGMFTMGALAASGTRTLEVTFKDIKLVVDGTEVVPKDAAGNVVEPFVYNGTTYLPVRAVGEALGKGVTWDGNTNTVYIGNAQALPYQVNGGTLYDGSKPDTSFSVAGQKYTKGAVLKSLQSSYSLHEDYNFEGSALWNTEGCENMTFTVGCAGNLQWDATLYVSLDGLAAGEYPLRWDGSPQTITVPLGGSPNVKLTLVAETVDTGRLAIGKNLAAFYGIYDITLS